MRLAKLKRAGAFTMLSLLTWSASNAAEVPLQTLHLRTAEHGEFAVRIPAGFEIEFLDAVLRQPRMIAFAPDGNMLIGSGLEVYMLKPPYERVSASLPVKNYPHSAAVRGDELLVATTNALYSAEYDGESLAAGPLRESASLPGGFGHSSRTLGIGPDGAIYVSLGISGNCSDEYLSRDYPFRKRRGGIMRLEESGGEAAFEPFASGLRNPVGFAWHPATQVMYAANNGPDHLGFDSPPEYFSKILPGSFHGMPWFQYDGQSVYRDTCIKSSPPRPLQEVEKPVAVFPARNAPLGMAFVPSGALREPFELGALVTLHGSWATLPDGGFFGKASTRRGPGVALVVFDDGEATGQVLTVVDGLQREDGDRLARPAGIAVGADGAIYVTSDGGLFHGLMRLRARSN